MAARIIKVAGLVVLAAALSAQLASAKPYVADETGYPAVPASRAISAPVASSYLNTPALDQGMKTFPGSIGPSGHAVQSSYLNTPALDQGMNAVVAPNDKAGTQGIGQNSTDFGMGGQYGQNLIQQKAQDIQKAKTFTLPAPPDERPGTASSAGTPLVIPYLSHGVGVSAAQFSGSPASPDDRSGARGAQPVTPGNDTYDVGGVLVKAHPVATPSVPTRVASPPVSTAGDGFNWGIAGYGAAGLAAIALAIGLLVVLGRRSRHEGVAVS
ncbi:MAG TPA: hypothetical protein VMT59_00285 [Gaiellaceae bacterium]|nr:hypothetical protein [Gaiellaceae bacterium]